MKLYVVGFGSGSRGGITAEAENALRTSDLIVGYRTYTEIIGNFFPEKNYYSNGMNGEVMRVRKALSEARDKTVSLICSGDPELYGMAALAYELGAEYPDAEIEIIPGVTAAFSGGSILGAPLTDDFAVISLSDLITPRDVIEKRLRCAAEADFVIVIYNPSSKKRKDHLKNACRIIMEYRPPETVCGFAVNIGRDEQKSGIMSLGELTCFEADMFTTVFVGNSKTRDIDGKMVTPRGYKICSDL